MKTLIVITAAVVVAVAACGQSAGSAGAAAGLHASRVGSAHAA